MPRLSSRPAASLVCRVVLRSAVAVILGIVGVDLSSARETSKTGAAAARQSPPTPGIYHLETLRRVEAARLDRSHCFLLQAISPIDLRGPHLPANTALELSKAMTEEVALRLRKAKPEWSVVIMPDLPLGTGATGELGNVYFHTSSVALDMFALRRVLGPWFLGQAQNAYPNLSVISFHIDPQHLRAISATCDFYLQNFGMNTLNVMSYLMADSTTLARARILGQKTLGQVPEAELTFELMCGGVAETSLMLSLRPDEVDGKYSELEPYIATSWNDALIMVKAFGWPGYLGHPARATRAYGQALWEILADQSTELILERSGGSTLVGRPRFEEVITTEFELREAIRASQRVYNRHIQRYDTWLSRWATADKAANGNKSIEP